MTEELKFKNLTIKYNNEELSKSTIRKTTIKEYAIISICLIIYFVGIALNGTLLGFEQHPIPTLIIGFVLSAIFVFGIAYILSYYHEKVAPRHYDFISWLMRYKEDEIEIGWFNDRYIINMYSQKNGWIKKEFESFIDEDYKLEDNANKSKPIHMTIDFVDGDIKVETKNK